MLHAMLSDWLMPIDAAGARTRARAPQAVGTEAAPGGAGLGPGYVQARLAIGCRIGCTECSGDLLLPSHAERDIAFVER